MNLSAPFVARPVATTLLAIGVVLAGAVAFTQLPVSPLPQVDYPTISVQASLPGANPETMASTVATPLERALGRIAGVTEITSSSSLGSSRITLQFDLNRNINDAATEVQSAINAARSQLPSGMPNNPTYRYHLGMVYSKTGDPQKAREMLQSALKLNPNFPGASDARRTLDSLGGTR
jgi:multidrug efflux pump